MSTLIFIYNTYSITIMFLFDFIIKKRIYLSITYNCFVGKIMDKE